MGFAVVFFHHPPLELLPFLGAHGLALGLALALLDGQQHPGGAAAAHHAGARPHGGEQEMGTVGPAAHAVVGGPVVRPDDELDARHLGAGDGPDHVGPVLADAQMLHLGAHHVARRVLDEEQRRLFLGTADDPFRRLSGRLGEDDSHAVGGDHAHGNPLEADFPGDDVAAPAGGVVGLVLGEMAVVGDGPKHPVAVDALVAAGGHEIVQRVRRGAGGPFLVAVNLELLRRVQGKDFPDPRHRLGLVAAEMVGPAGDVGVDLRPAQVLGGDHLARGHLHQRRPAQKRVGHLVDHHRLAGHEDDVRAARRVAAGGKGHLLQPFGRHPGHVVEHGAEVAVVRKHVGLHGQKGAARIGDIDAVEPAIFGDGLGPDVLFQGDGEIGSGLDPGIVAQNHGPIAVDFAQPGDEAAAGHVVDALGIVDAESGQPAQFEKFGAGIDQLVDQFPHRSLALLGQPLHRLLAARPQRGLDSFLQRRFLPQPVFPIFAHSIFLPSAPPIDPDRPVFVFRGTPSAPRSGLPWEW